MIYLKEANIEDSEKEYRFLNDIPAYENGFENKYFGLSYDDFMNKALPQLINFSNGIDLPNGYVPETYYFLWDKDNVVGLFKLRHYLTDSLRNGAGHIGYAIHKNYRGKGYGTKGLALAIERAKNVIKENEIYMSVHIDNPISLKVQLNNDAYIHHSNEKEHYTRIRLF